MSSRALRRLRGKQRGQEALDLGGELGQAAAEEEEEQEEEEEEDASPQLSKPRSGRKAKKNKTQKNLSNIYELVRLRFPCRSVST